MRAWITPERSLTIQRLVASLKPGTTCPLEGFSEVTQPYGGHRLCNSSEPASHVAVARDLQSEHKPL